MGVLRLPSRQSSAGRTITSASRSMWTRFYPRWVRSRSRAHPPTATREGAEPGPRRMGAHAAGSGRLRRQYLAVRQAAGNAPALGATKAVQGSASRLKYELEGKGRPGLLCRWRTDHSRRRGCGSRSVMEPVAHLKRRSAVDRRNGCHRMSAVVEQEAAIRQVQGSQGNRHSFSETTCPSGEIEGGVPRQMGGRRRSIHR